MSIAITGGIGEGKSTVLAHIASLGFRTASADSVAREIFSQPAINDSLARLVGVSGPISPQNLREAIVQSPGIRRAVNRITHPAVMEAIRQSGAEFVEVPLLVEACLQGRFASIWVVTCGPEAQVERLRARYGPNVDVRMVLNTQLPTSSKIPFADEVIRTNCSDEAVRRDISMALARRFE